MLLDNFVSETSNEQAKEHQLLVKEKRTEDSIGPNKHICCISKVLTYPHCTYIHKHINSQNPSPYTLGNVVDPLMRIFAVEYIDHACLESSVAGMF